jgi:hypothetical protein
MAKRRKRRKNVRVIDARRVLKAQAHARHMALWLSCGCNPMTFPLHILAVEMLYGPG